jgi:hypothetical protein
MEHVTERAVVKYHDLAQVRFYGAEVLDECSVSECAVLTIVSPSEELAF